MDIKKKRRKEKEIVSLMIHLYCQKHKDINEFELKDYALMKIERCPMMATKTFCSQCSIHCYQKEKQKQIKKVMRYSGKRMLFYHPLLTMKHFLRK